jgi:hypothetical protein
MNFPGRYALALFLALVSAPLFLLKLHWRSYFYGR